MPEERASWIRGQRDILERVALGDSLADTLAAIALLIDAHAYSSTCAIQLYDAATGQMLRGAAPGMPADYFDIIHGLVLGPEDGTCGAAVASRSTAVVSDVLEHPLWRAFEGHARRWGIRGARSTPIPGREGGVLGTVALYRREPGEPDPHDAWLVDDVFHIARIAIERQQTEARQQRTVAALRESESRFALVARATNDAVWDWRFADDSLVWNDAVFTMFRYGHDEPVGSLEWWAEHVHPDDRDRVTSGIQRAIDDGESTWADEYRFLCGDGQVATVFDRGSVLRDEEGRAVRMIGSMLDLTERAQLEQQLRQSQRMEVVGQLAGGVAHDFNNILTAILTGCELALDELEAGHPVRDGIIEIRQAGERAAGLTRQLLAFGRRQVVQPSEVDLNETIAETEGMFRRVISANIRLETTLAAGLDAVKVDRGQIGQVLLNLVVNARDAMPDGGTLSIRTNNVSVADGGVPGLVAGRYVVLTIADTGVGMDEETRAHIFEPFFTTKDVGKGTGLGLATVYAIVEQAGGAIQVRTALGAGTSIQLFFPAHAHGADGAEPGIRGEHAPVPRTAGGDSLRGSETVLLAEDEGAVRTLVRRTLERHGYTVLEAIHGADALRVHADSARHVDILVTDVMMPVMSGPDAAAILRERDRGLRVLFVSGYAEEAVRMDGALLPESHFLGKPFSPHRLLVTLREILDAQGR